jgi:hypothetical protein
MRYTKRQLARILEQTVDPDTLQGTAQSLWALHLSDPEALSRIAREALVAEETGGHGASATLTEALTQLVERAVAAGAPHDCDLWRCEDGRCRMCARIA